MKIITENYINYKNRIPAKGRHILAYQESENIAVYQAFNPKIAKYAVENQTFGGEDYRYSRMSWIKPNFLWMMYRCGWCEKEGQKRVLRIWIKKTDFDKILAEAVFSSFDKQIYGSVENWRAILTQKKVRLQWDPDHNPLGQKEERKAIQLGLKGTVLEQFGQKMIQEIEDITPWVRQQKNILEEQGMEAIEIPKETIYIPKEKITQKLIGLSPDNDIR